MKPQWLTWAQQIQAIAQNGLTYSENPYDLERYQQLQAIAAEILTNYTGIDNARWLALWQGESGYATPKVDVRGAVFRDGKVLLVQERSDGGWTLPGGWADVGDSPATAVVREIREEAGFETEATKLLAVYDRDAPHHGHPPLAHHVYKLFFRCEITGGAPSVSLETAAVAFFAREQIPTLSLTRVVPSQIERLFDHLDNPHLPTEFD